MVLDQSLENLEGFEIYTMFRKIGICFVMKFKKNYFSFDENEMNYQNAFPCTKMQPMPPSFALN